MLVDDIAAVVVDLQPQKWFFVALN